VYVIGIVADEPAEVPERPLAEHVHEVRERPLIPRLTAQHEEVQRKRIDCRRVVFRHELSGTLDDSSPRDAPDGRKVQSCGLNFADSYTVSTYDR
jgi:hypothetical protein